jgi:2,4-dienoyl-CoA reductase-like NADH-dependent reductase (Old Yellow Enzyme family)
MSAPFEAITINGMNLKNRFVRSATWEGLAGGDGRVTPKLCALMAQLAENEVALVISGYAIVSADGQSSSRQLAAHEDRFLPGLCDMAQAVHAAGGKIALQLVHAGKFSTPGLTGQTPMGPSAEENDQELTCRAMSHENIESVTAAFSAAALRAQQAGYDAVQLHAAHGFLLSQFLSPAFNRRIDEYGGTLVNRARFLLEVVRSIRSAVGPEFPILIKLNSEDFLPEGMTRNEGVEVAALLEGASADAIEISGGTVASQEFVPPRPGILKSPEAEGYYREAALLHRQKIGIPIMLVGGIRSLEVAEELLESGAADLIALSRPLICEPGLLKRWHEGDRRPSRCLSCNACFGPAFEGNGFYCVAFGKDK